MPEVNIHGPLTQNFVPGSEVPSFRDLSLDKSLTVIGGTVDPHTGAFTKNTGEAYVSITEDGKLSLKAPSVTHVFEGDVTINGTISGNGTVTQWNNYFASLSAEDTRLHEQHMEVSDGLEFGKDKDGNPATGKFGLLQKLEDALNSRLTSIESAVKATIDQETLKRKEMDDLEAYNRSANVNAYQTYLTQLKTQQNADHSELQRVATALDTRQDEIDARISDAIGDHNVALDNIGPRLQRLESIFMVDYSQKRVIIDPEFKLFIGADAAGKVDAWKQQFTNKASSYSYTLNQDPSKTYTDAEIKDPAMWIHADIIASSTTPVDTTTHSYTDTPSGPAAVNVTDPSAAGVGGGSGGSTGDAASYPQGVTVPPATTVTN